VRLAPIQEEAAVSPKINKSGVSYDESDPRSAVPRQRGENDGPRVTRARDFDAAQEGLRRDDEMNDSSVNAEDEEEIEERPRPDYGSWTKAQLNEELDRREIEHDPKANNLVLVNLLEESDGGTQTGVND
jgi:hypothetical protein